MTFVDVDLVVFLRLCQGVFTLCRDKKMMQKKSSADVTQKTPEECKTQKPTLDTAEGHNDGRGKKLLRCLSPLLLGGSLSGRSRVQDSWIACASNYWKFDSAARSKG